MNAKEIKDAREAREVLHVEDPVQKALREAVRRGVEPGNVAAITRHVGRTDEWEIVPGGMKPAEGDPIS